MNLVTGGNGFIGQRLIHSLHAASLPVICFSREAPTIAIPWCSGDVTHSVSEIQPAFRGVKTVFHCAGHAHAFKATKASDAERHWKVNLQGTQNVLAAAIAEGVQTFVFLSSVKAMAEPGTDCADERYSGAPNSEYGLAKRAAEEAVLEAGKVAGMRVTNLRLSMVYGSRGRGNLERMARLIQRGWFPPLPETGNHRSMVHVDDVVDAMRLVADDPRANGETYIVAGPESPSGRQLYDAIRHALNLAPREWAMPASLMRVAALSGDIISSLTGRRMPMDSEVLSRLLSSAWYSADKIRHELGWSARIGLAEGLKELLGQ